MMIDLPALKETLWHQMREDLGNLAPWFRDSELLLCPLCCRALRYDEFSLEHIIPQQALADDPPDVRRAVSKNERSGMTLLCRRPLIYKGKPVPGHGCNGWKGRYYDSFLREFMRPGASKSEGLSVRHQIAVFSVGFLALFRQFGYRTALSKGGLLARSQFFNPNRFLPEMPLSCQMMLTGDSLKAYDISRRTYWSDPFKITVESGFALVVFRSTALRVPLSEDPTVPLARVLAYAPQKHTFRPDFATFFD